jgi:hypothetical protein
MGVERRRDQPGLLDPHRRTEPEKGGNFNLLIRRSTRMAPKARAHGGPRPGMLSGLPALENPGGELSTGHHYQSNMFHCIAPRREV